MQHGWSHITYEGIPAWCKQWADGTSAVVAEQGAQLLSWRTPDGREHLYLSPASARDGHSAIRGGVPVCFPQFNARGPLPKHGFARNLPWQLAAAGDGFIALCLADSAQTRQSWPEWPEAFEALLRVDVSATQLAITLDVRNTGATPWAMTCALHTYLQVDDVTQTQLTGLQGTACWDALADRRFVESADRIDFGAQPGAGFDRVFSTPGAAGKSLQVLQHGGYTLGIHHHPNTREAVVWNPGAELTRTLADMPEGGWRHMLCVEAASIDAPVQLAPGAVWRLQQTLVVGVAAA